MTRSEPWDWPTSRIDGHALGCYRQNWRYAFEFMSATPALNLVAAWRAS